MSDAVRIETIYAGEHVSVIPLASGIAIGVQSVGQEYAEVYLYPSQILGLIHALANTATEVWDD